MAKINILVEKVDNKMTLFLVDWHSAYVCYLGISIGESVAWTVVVKDPLRLRHGKRTNVLEALQGEDRARQAVWILLLS